MILVVQHEFQAFHNWNGRYSSLAFKKYLLNSLDCDFSVWPIVGNDMLVDMKSCQTQRNIVLELRSKSLLKKQHWQIEKKHNKICMNDMANVGY